MKAEQLPGHGSVSPRCMIKPPSGVFVRELVRPQQVKRQHDSDCSLFPILSGPVESHRTAAINRLLGQEAVPENLSFHGFWY